MYNVSRIFIKSLLLFSISGIPLFASAQQPTLQSSAPTITVAGLGSVELKPDRATIGIGVETVANTAATASAENAKKLQSIFSALKKLGLRDEQITTQMFSVSPDYRQKDDPSGKTERLFITRNMIQVDIRNLVDIPKVIDASLNAGANEIAGVELGAPNMEEARKNALSQAVEKARDEADVIARAAGGSLGELLALTTQDDMREIRFSRGHMLDQVVVTGTVISPQNISVAASVTGRWKFVPGR